MEAEGEARVASSELDLPASQPHLVIWGTNVVVSRCKEKFKNFLINFVPVEAEEDELPENNDDEPFYVQKLDEVTSPQLVNLLPSVYMQMQIII